MKRFVSILVVVSVSACGAERDSRLAIINGNTRNKVVVRYDPSISPAKNNSTLSSPSIGRPIKSLSPQVTPLASITIEPKKTARLQLLSTQSFLVTVQIEGFEPLKDFRICSLRDALIIMPECDNKIKIIHGLEQCAIMTKDSAPIVVQRHTLKKEDVEECCCCLQ
jgi:hypothetical protein